MELLPIISLLIAGGVVVGGLIKANNNNDKAELNEPLQARKHSLEDDEENCEKSKVLIGGENMMNDTTINLDGSY